MNHNITLITFWPIGLFTIAILCALSSKRLLRYKAALSFFTALFSVFGTISAFVLGFTLQELLIPFLILLLISLYSLDRTEEEEE